MSEKNLKKFFHGHAVHDNEIVNDLKNTKSFDEFAEKLSAHGKKHGHNFTPDHVKETVKKEAAFVKHLKSKGISDEELQKVSGGSTIVVCIGGAMVAGSVAEGSADQIESGAWKVPPVSHW